MEVQEQYHLVTIDVCHYNGDDMKSDCMWVVNFWSDQLQIGYSSGKTVYLTFQSRCIENDEGFEV